MQEAKCSLLTNTSHIRRVASVSLSLSLTVLISIDVTNYVVKATFNFRAPFRVLLQKPLVCN